MSAICIVDSTVMIIKHVNNRSLGIKFSHLSAFEHFMHRELELFLIHEIVTTVVKISKHQ